MATWKTIDGLNEFVASGQTDFHTGHIRKHALIPLEKEKTIEVDSPRKKAFTYPDGTRIRLVPTPGEPSLREPRRSRPRD